MEQSLLGQPAEPRMSSPPSRLCLRPGLSLLYFWVSVTLMVDPVPALIVIVPPSLSTSTTLTSSFTSNVFVAVCSGPPLADVSGDGDGEPQAPRASRTTAAGVRTRRGSDFTGHSFARGAQRSSVGSPP